jgi:3'(2'), 5'-bisphosphate nucleotidase
MNDLIKKISNISIQAGNKILSFYDEEIVDIEDKSDGSPLTKADLASNEIIKKELGLIDQNINFLSEEGKNIDFEVRKNWNKLWVVDPLDGTKEFIKKNGEFTVNIALIENNKPVLGVIYAPALKTLYYAQSQLGSFKHTEVDIDSDIKFFDTKNRINCGKITDKMNIVASRSHPSEELEVWLKKFENFNLVDAGSSLKFCLVADGSADVYPRFVGSSEWDIAAGVIILQEAGGKVLDTDNNELLFNKPSLRNSFFIASSNSFLAS